MHSFAESLEFSNAASDWPGWLPFYRKCFPDLVEMVDHRKYGEHQRAGIDRSLTFSNSKQILVDEKVRKKDYSRNGQDDIFLEVFSDRDRKTDGWVVKKLRADFIAYVIAPAGRGYLLPVIQLQSAWVRCGAAWSRTYGFKDALNEGYWTRGVPVPVSVLFPEIGAELRLTFEPFSVTP